MTTHEKQDYSLRYTEFPDVKLAEVTPESLENVTLAGWNKDTKLWRGEFNGSRVFVKEMLSVENTERFDPPGGIENVPGTWFDNADPHEENHRLYNEAIAYKRGEFVDLPVPPFYFADDALLTVGGPKFNLDDYQQKIGTTMMKNPSRFLEHGVDDFITNLAKCILIMHTDILPRNILVTRYYEYLFIDLHTPLQRPATAFDTTVSRIPHVLSYLSLPIQLQQIVLERAADLAAEYDFSGSEFFREAEVAAHQQRLSAGYTDDAGTNPAVDVVTQADTWTPITELLVDLIPEINTEEYAMSQFMLEEWYQRAKEITEVQGESP